ncbi:hypothetical protein ACFOPQ_19425 [Deinococcus antarcticus]|uniref:Uncharacterized protein n=1 Tax=Deinococcus antarcticus TaxID=1298767 RepID=A0ABV8AFA8_9DEIO
MTGFYDPRQRDMSVSRRPQHRRDRSTAGTTSGSGNCCCAEESGG